MICVAQWCAPLSLPRLLSVRFSASFAPLFFLCFHPSPCFLILLRPDFPVIRVAMSSFEWTSGFPCRSLVPSRPFLSESCFPKFSASLPLSQWLVPMVLRLLALMLVVGLAWRRVAGAFRCRLCLERGLVRFVCGSKMMTPAGCTLGSTHVSSK